MPQDSPFYIVLAPILIIKIYHNYYKYIADYNII